MKISKDMRHPKLLLKKLIWDLISLLPRREITVNTQYGVLTFTNKDKLIGKNLYVGRVYEYNLMMNTVGILIKHGLYNPRGGLIDVGANIGMTSIPLVKKGLFSQALAFEPEPYNYSLLTKNVRQNGLIGRIQCFNVALSSREGTAQLEVSASNFGNHRLSVADPKTTETRFVTVQTCTLDRFLLHQTHIPQSDIALVWVDIEGHEAHFLEGSQKIVRTGIPVMSEFWPYQMKRCGTSEKQYCQLVCSLFRHFYDMTETQPRCKPIESITELFHHYAEPREMGNVLFLGIKR